MTSSTSDRSARRNHTRFDRVVTLFAKLGCGLLLSGVAFGTTGCHDLYCGFVEGLTGVPLDCSHDPFPDLPDVPLPDLPPPPQLPPRTATIHWDEPVVAGEPETLTATGGFGAADRPLRYGWDLDNDGAYDDHEGVGEEGHTATTTFPAAGERTVKVRVTRASDQSPSSSDTALGTATIAVTGGTSTPGTPPGGEQPPGGGGPAAPNPLEVSIELGNTAQPPSETPATRVTGVVTQDGGAVAGAAVSFDFESDGSVDATATSDAAGRASQVHRYPDGQHTVTVSATQDGTSGSASRTFTTDSGVVSPKLLAAGNVRRRAFTASFGLTWLKEGKRTRRGNKVSRVGELSIGGLVGRLRGTTPPSLRGLLKSTWLTRSTIAYDRRRRTAKVSGVAVATFVDAPGQACIRYSTSTKVGRRSGKARLSLLGGSGPAATIRGVATGKVKARRGRFVLSGTLTTSTVSPRGLNAACQRVLAEAAQLPG